MARRCDEAVRGLPRGARKIFPLSGLSDDARAKNRAERSESVQVIRRS
jgi:hypothetical protein